MKRSLLLISIAIGIYILAVCGINFIKHKLNQQRERNYVAMNMFSAENLYLEFMNLSMYGETELSSSQFKDPIYQRFRFESAAGLEDWLFDPKGFGIIKNSHTTNILVTPILIAPRVLDDKVIVCCSDGSIIHIPIEELDEIIDISKIKTL